MGDHRASITIIARAHGVERRMVDAWINYFPEDGGVSPDRRVREFFEEWWSDALQAYDRSVAPVHREESERRERAEYERLSAKYGEKQDAQD